MELTKALVVAALSAVVTPPQYAQSVGSGIGWGGVWGFVWWILGALILMPVFLGMPAFAPLQMPPMRMVAMGSLIGHLIFGVVMGFVFARLYVPVAGGAAASARMA